MSTGTDVAPLLTPQDSWDALRKVVVASKGSSQIAHIMSESGWIASMHDIARPIVAAELRHQARLIDEQVEVMYEAGDSEDGMAAYEAIAAALRARADQLDPREA